MKTLAVLIVVVTFVAFVNGNPAAEGVRRCSETYHQAGAEAEADGTFNERFCDILRTYMNCLVSFLGQGWDDEAKRAFASNMENSMSQAGFNCNLAVDV